MDAEDEYLFGAKGAAALRQLLSKSANPAAVIAQFQSEHVVKEIPLEPLMPYFDRMGVTRFEVHAQVMGALRERLVGRVQGMSEDM
jgi:hypothetical protein